jgi:hypothetical protein
MHFASNVPNAMCHWPVNCMLRQGTGQPHSAHHVYFKSNGACTSLLRMSVGRSRQIQTSTMFEDLITRVARVSEALHRERVHLREIPDAALESRNQIRRFDTFERVLKSRFLVWRPSAYKTRLHNDGAMTSYGLCERASRNWRVT